MKFIILLIIFLVTLNANNKPLNILIFQSYHHTLPWSKQFLKGINEFKNNSKREIKFYIETVDYIRLKEHMSSDDWEEYLQKKYKNLQFDGILIETVFASRTFKDFSSRLYADVPKIHLSDIDIDEEKNTKLIIESKVKIVQKSIKLVKKHNTKLENVYIIKAHKAGQAIEEKLLEELKKETFNTIIIEDFTYKQLQQKLSKLPPNSAVFYILNFKDKNGVKFIPRDFISGIAPFSNAPVYAFWSTFLDTGIIGGYMLDGSISAKIGLKSLMHFIDNKEFEKNIDTFKLFLDHKILSKYNLEEYFYDEEVTVINKPNLVWNLYPKETFFAISIISLLTLLLILTITLKIRNERISKMKEEMQLQSKQAALGEMLSVIAHQWRQPLNSIAIMVQTILLKYKKNKIDDVIMSSFKTDILKQITYMSDTIDDFKDFYRPNKEKCHFDIKEELMQTITLLGETYAQKGIKINVNNIEEFDILGYPNELTHCFLIILQNANDALVKSTNKEKIIEISSYSNNKIYKLIFENNGKKIPEEILGKIFQAYFSTKNNKNGTGIGLYMTKVIIEKQFDALIEVSNTNTGVRYEISFKKKNKELF